MLMINKKTIDNIKDDDLIKIKRDFEDSLANKKMNDIQRSELKQMIEYLETKIINNQVNKENIDNNF